MDDFMTAMIVDDEIRGVKAMERLLQINCPDVKVTGSFVNVQAAIASLVSGTPDLLFLDIAMPEKYGFELLRELGNFTFEVIFVTAHNQFMIEAFHFSAVDYLLKPVEDDLLIDAVDRAKKRIRQKAGDLHIHTLLHNMNQQQTPQKLRLCIPSQNGFTVLNLDEILFAEAAGNYTNLYLTNEKVICTTRPMHEYESRLEDGGFVRIHKSFLVNLAHLKEYRRGEGGVVVLSNGQEIEVSRRKKDILMSQIKMYFRF